MTKGRTLLYAFHTVKEETPPMIINSHKERLGALLIRYYRVSGENTWHSKES